MDSRKEVESVVCPQQLPSAESALDLSATAGVISLPPAHYQVWRTCSSPANRLSANTIASLSEEKLLTGFLLLNSQVLPIALLLLPQDLNLRRVLSEPDSWKWLIGLVDVVVGSIRTVTAGEGQEMELTNRFQPGKRIPIRRAARLLLTRPPRVFRS